MQLKMNQGKLFPLKIHICNYVSQAHRTRPAVLSLFCLHSKVTSYVKMGCHGEMKITTGGSFILQETSCCVCCNSKINIPCSAVVEMQTGSSFSDSGIYFSPGSCGTCSGEVLTIRGSYRGISFAMGVVTQAPDELQQKIAKAKMWCDAQPDSVADGSSA